MSWEFNKHHVAQKVLEKHLNELDRKQSRIAARQDENMRDVERQLISLYSSTPDLGQCFGTPRRTKKGLPGLPRSANKSLTGGGEDAPTYGNTTRQPSSRLYSRRQSEPVAMVGRDLEDIQRLMNKATCLKDEFPDETANSLLASTLPGHKDSTIKMSRLHQRRGTIAVTEGLDVDKYRLASSTHDYPPVKKSQHRRASLPKSADLKIHVEDSRAKSSKQKTAKKSTGKDSQKPVSKKKSKKGKSKSFKELNGVNVTFYNEDTGEESIPVVPPLELNRGEEKSEPDGAMVAEDNSAEDDSSDEKSIENDSEYIWKDVAKCRYIRGYDPPEMRVPTTDTATFVFGRSYSDAHEEKGVREGRCAPHAGTPNFDTQQNVKE